MPYRPKHGCQAPGCPALVQTGSYCEKHRKVYQKPSNEARQRFESGRTWQAIRRYHLSHHPLCEDCLTQGITKVAEQVHHIDGCHEHNLESNLQSLCRSCHSKHTIREQG